MKLFDVFNKKSILLLSLSVLVLSMSGCSKKCDVDGCKNPVSETVQNIENEEKIIENAHEEKLTSEKWIDIGERNSDTIEYCFFEGGTYKSQTLSGSELETGMYKIKGNKLLLINDEIEFDYIDDGGVFKRTDGKRIIRQDEVYRETYYDAVLGTRYLIPESLYNSDSVYTGCSLDISGIPEVYEILNCYHGIHISTTLCADFDYLNPLENSFNGISDLYPVTNFNSTEDIKAYYTKYITQEYLDNSDFQNICNDYFEEHNNKLYMRFPSFGFDSFKTEKATIIKIDENQYMITQPYYVCDNYCDTVIIFIEKSGGGYKMVASRENN